MTASQEESLQKMAESMFALAKMAWRQRLASRQRDEEELSESQFLTLDLLITRDKPQTVGDVIRAIHVAPAQMSRVIRSLENDFAGPLIRCELNQRDKRKIDVHLTAAGRNAYEQFRDARLRRSREILAGLSERDRIDFVRICGQMRKLYARAEQGGQDKSPPPT